MEVSLPAFAHRVTVFGSTRNIDATSAGVSSGSGSCVRDAMVTPPHVPISNGRGPAGRRVTHSPASPRCPTWAERVKVRGWTDDQRATCRFFDLTTYLM